MTNVKIKKSITSYSTLTIQDNPRLKVTGYSKPAQWKNTSINFKERIGTVLLPLESDENNNVGNPAKIKTYSPIYLVLRIDKETETIKLLNIGFVNVFGNFERISDSQVIQKQFEDLKLMVTFTTLNCLKELDLCSK